jgi:hypothetical protein
VIGRHLGMPYKRAFMPTSAALEAPTAGPFFDGQGIRGEGSIHAQISERSVAQKKCHVGGPAYATVGVRLRTKTFTQVRQLKGKWILL